MASFTLKRGTTVILDGAVTDETGAAVTLVGGTLYFTVKASLTDTDANALIKSSKAASAAGTVAGCTWTFTSDVGGLFRLEVLAATNAALAPATYFYDVEFKDAAGRIWSLDNDLWIVQADVTQSNP